MFREVALDIVSCIRLNDLWREKLKMLCPVTVKIKVGCCYIGNLQMVFDEPQSKGPWATFSKPTAYWNAMQYFSIQLAIKCSAIFFPLAHGEVLLVLTATYGSWKAKVYKELDFFILGLWSVLQSWDYILLLLHNGLVHYSNKLFTCVYRLYIYTTTYVYNLCFFLVCQY